MRPQQQNYQQWAECYTEEQFDKDLAEWDKRVGFDASKYKIKDGKLESIEQTLEQRGENYGNFDEQAFICQGIKFAMKESYPEKWNRLYCRQKEALEMIAHKMARIINGNPHYADSWHDIAGYATLVERECNKND